MSSMSWNPYLFDINRQYLGQKLRLKMGHFTVSLLIMRVTPPRVHDALVTSASSAGHSKRVEVESSILGVARIFPLLQRFPSAPHRQPLTGCCLSEVQLLLPSQRSVPLQRGTPTPRIKKAKISA